MDEARSEQDRLGQPELGQNKSSPSWVQLMQLNKMDPPDSGLDHMSEQEMMVTCMR